MENTICLLTKWTLQAYGLFKADGVFLIKKGACVIVKDLAFHLEGEIGHAPKCAAVALVDVWKQTLVIRAVPCF